MGFYIFQKLNVQYHTKRFWHLETKCVLNIDIHIDILEIYFRSFLCWWHKQDTSKASFQPSNLTIFFYFILLVAFGKPTFLNWKKSWCSQIHYCFLKLKKWAPLYTKMQTFMWNNFGLWETNSNWILGI